MVDTIATYLRTSKEVENGSFSIETQKNIALEFIKELYESGHLPEYENLEQALEFVLFYIDKNISGITLDRPEMNRMQLDMDNGKVGTVIVYKVDRFSRNMFDGVLSSKHLRDKGIKFFAFEKGKIDLFDPRNEKELIHALSVARDEHTNIKDRTLRGKIQAINSGEGFLGGEVPFGFKREKRFDSNKTYYAIDEPNAEIIRIIFKEFLNGKTKKEIAEYITHVLGFKKNTTIRLLGMEVKAKKNVTIQWINRALSNPIYAGYNFKRDKNYKPTEELVEIKVLEFEGIIPVESYLKVQQQLKSKVRTLKTESPFLLKDQLVCLVCGSKYTTKSDRNDTYICSKKAKESMSCSSSQIIAKSLEGIIVNECIAKLNSVLEEKNTSVIVLTNRIYNRSLDVRVFSISEVNRKAYIKIQEKRQLVEQMYRDEEINNSQYKRIVSKISSQMHEMKKKQESVLASKKYDPNHPLYVSTKKEMKAVIKKYGKEFEDYIAGKIDNVSNDLRNFISDMLLVITTGVYVGNENEYRIDYIETNELLKGYKIAEK